MADINKFLNLAKKKKQIYGIRFCSGFINRGKMNLKIQNGNFNYI